jgi:hypothetical protein
MSKQFFAQLDEDNVVIHVAVTSAEFMIANPDRYQGRWVETFFDTVGKTYAGLGYVFNQDTEDFEAPPEPVKP